MTTIPVTHRPGQRPSYYAVVDQKQREKAPLALTNSRYPPPSSPSRPAPSAQPRTYLMATWKVRPTTLHTRHAACASAQLHAAAASLPPASVGPSPALVPLFPFFLLWELPWSLGAGGCSGGDPGRLGGPLDADAVTAAAAVAGAVASSTHTLMRSTTRRKMSASRDCRWAFTRSSHALFAGFCGVI